MNYTNNPYMNPYYNMNFNNPYANMQQPIQQRPVQPQPQQVMQPQQPVQIQQIGLQGKAVDNIEVVKATDIPLDGSVSYFPIIDGSAIVTKQLQADGTSKITVYKPITDEQPIKEQPKYITVEEFEEKMKSINTDAYKEDMKKINRQIEDLSDELDSITKNFKKRKEE